MAQGERSLRDDVTAGAVAGAAFGATSELRISDCMPKPCASEEGEMACGFKTASPEERKLLVLSDLPAQRRGTHCVVSQPPY